jgi:uncharacterized membrane protein YfcA
MLRIHKARWRLAYVVVGIALLLALNGFVLLRVLPAQVDAVIFNLLVLAFVFVAVRSFRGRDEAVEPPRVWWRMTARPTAGLLIAAFLAASVVNYLFSTTARAPGDEFTNGLSTAVNALLVIAYVHSSIRLIVAASQAAQERAAQQETQPRST